MSMDSVFTFIKRMESDTEFRTRVLASNDGKRVELLKKEGFHFTPSEYSTRQTQIVEGAFLEDETKMPGADINRIAKDSWLSQSFYSEAESAS